ncbi:MAG: phosphoribosyl-AMP cyclohydrolase [Candidatus Nanopelagicaceae bacterium]|nr:phosphoribosyl-AMP cyclohydrolase [Candidatus Nanopelagicaceae bacterium]
MKISADLANLLDRENGLVAVVVQEDESNEVLMLAWMNREALEKTLESHEATYWSRSRNELWVKGATSGNTQEVVSASVDCDGDAILLRVHQKGVACHTGAHSCFSNEIEISG